MYLTTNVLNVYHHVRAGTIHHNPTPKPNMESQGVDL